MRSAYCAEWPLQQTIISGTVAAYQIQSTGNRQDINLFEQQQDIAGLDHMRSVQKQMGDRTVFSTDQTEPPHQELLRNIGECSKDANLDCRFGIRANSDRQKKTESGTAALHFSTDSIRGCFRENALAASLCGNGLQYER
jgi:protoporphyrinogen oxidase